MQRFSISNEDYEIQALAAGSMAPEGSTGFDSEKELAKIAGEWPMARLVGIWNGLTGVTAVRKFKDRGTAVNRIWKQIQSLTPPPPLAEPEKPARAVKAAKKKAKGEAQPTERGKQGAEQPTAMVTGSAGSKKAQVVAMLDAAEGVTLAQIMEATGWQKHSVRGFLSGMIGKKMGLKLLSFKGSAGERVYRIEALDLLGSLPQTFPRTFEGRPQAALVPFLKKRTG